MFRFNTNTFRWILDLILPKECVGCGISKTWLCEACASKLRLSRGFECVVCHRASLLGAVHKECQRQTNLNGVIAASTRGALLKELIRVFKYENLSELVLPLARLLLQKIEASPLLLSMLMSPATLLVPVPLHQKREWERGFNQAELLAREIAGSFPAQLAGNVVVRTKKTKTQTGFRRGKRLKNVKDAFEVADPLMVVSHSVVLIDDITTSGATLGEVANVLKSAGAKEVWGLVLSRG